MKKILVIEPNLLLKENLIELLQTEEFSVVAVKNACQALLLIQKSLPDLVIYDLGGLEILDFPELQNLEKYLQLELLWKTAKRAKFPLVILLNTLDIYPQIALLADTCIIKPFERVNLLTAISTHLNQTSITKQKVML